MLPRVKLVMFEHPENPLVSPEPSNVQLSALNSTDIRPLQPLNAEVPMELTEFPMVTNVKPLQPENAEFPMEVTELGMVTDVKPLHPENAEFPMEVTEFPMVTDVKPLQP